MQIRSNGNAIDDIRAPRPVGVSGPEEIERICMRNLLASSQERVFFKDLEGRFLIVSAGFVSELGRGRSLADAVGRTDFDIFSGPHAREALADEREIIRTGEPLVAKIERETFEDRPDVWVSTTKWPLRDERGEIIGTFGISRDVTVQVETQDALAYQALHDAVTGVANRLALMDRLSQALMALERQPGRLALLFIDLDDFKAVIDTFGHEVGDAVLLEVANRLQRVARRTDTVARFGGDEFVVLCTALGSDDELRQIGDRIMRALRAPLKCRPKMTLTGSLGAVMTRDPLADPAELLQQADFAMYAAKRAGRNRWEVYDPEQHGLVATARGMLAELPRAIDQRELLERHRIAPPRLCLEITETALVGELDAADQIISSLTRYGVRIALDDFGTGYSTLAHLQQLRADILKIDRSFIAKLGRESRERQIIAAVTAMAHALGMVVIGEGVETGTQRDELAAIDRDEAQGDLLAPPLPAHEIATLWATTRH